MYTASNSERSSTDQTKVAALYLQTIGLVSYHYHEYNF